MHNDPLAAPHIEVRELWIKPKWYPTLRTWLALKSVAQNLLAEVWPTIRIHARHRFEFDLFSAGGTRQHHMFE
jgi:hypothetical protein